MVTVADIQKDLPNWPKEVIDPWLIEFANDPGMGWPPPKPYGDHRWMATKVAGWKLRAINHDSRRNGKSSGVNYI
jgi:hypothetical protein